MGMDGKGGESRKRGKGRKGRGGKREERKGEGEKGRVASWLLRVGWPCVSLTSSLHFFSVFPTLIILHYRIMDSVALRRYYAHS